MSLLEDGVVRVAYDPQAEAMSIALCPAMRVDRTIEAGDGMLLDMEGDEVGSVEVLASSLPDSFPVIAAKYGFAHKVAACYRAVATVTSMTVSPPVRLTMCEASSRFPSDSSPTWSCGR